jgi:magnesium chelatase subunit D
MFTSAEPFALKQIKIAADNKVKKGNGRRSSVVSNDKRGKYFSDCIPDGKTSDIALSATIRAAAPNQLFRQNGDLAISIESSDIREKVRKRKIGNTIVFVVDSSGSMGVSQRMKETKAAILSLLVDAYQKRDKVALVVFKQNSAELILPPTSSVELARKQLEYIPTGGKSPLPHGLLAGFQCVISELKRHKDCKPLLVLISDGRANVSMNKESNPFDETTQIARQIKQAQIDSLVIDTEKGFIRLGKLEEIANTLGAKYLKLEELKAGNIVQAIGLNGN